MRIEATAGISPVWSLSATHCGLNIKPHMDGRAVSNTQKLDFMGQSYVNSGGNTLISNTAPVTVLRSAVGAWWGDLKDNRGTSGRNSRQWFLRSVASCCLTMKGFSHRGCLPWCAGAPLIPPALFITLASCGWFTGVSWQPPAHSTLKHGLWEGGCRRRALDRDSGCWQ